MRLTFALNRSEVTDLPVPAFNAAGFGVSLGVFRIEEGASATQIVGNKGLLPDGTCCVVGKVGDTEPDFRTGLWTQFGYAGFKLGALVDWQQGSSIINLTRLLYDANQNTSDYESKGETRLNRWAGEGQTSSYIEDASFVKLRELVLSWQVPDAWMTRLDPIDTFVVSVSGRNLLTWSSYSGLDPEVSNFGNRPIGRNIDVAPYPPMRSVWLTLSANL